MNERGIQMKTKKIKSLLTLTTVSIMILSIAACSSQNTVKDEVKPSSTISVNSTAAPGTATPSKADAKPTQIKFFRVAVEQDPKKDRMLLELQKRTNTNIEFVTAPWDQVATKVQIILSSGEQMDVMAIDPGQVDFINLAKSGAILPLDDYLKTDKYPIAKKLAYDPLFFKKYQIDGKVYGIPQPIQPGDWNNIIRKDWLQNVGLEMPKTPEEMYEVFKRFKHNDPDKNGKEDTLGRYVAQLNDGLGPILNMFMSSSIQFDEINGKIVHNFSSEKYKKGLMYINKLYQDGLINKDFATIKDRDYILNQFAANKAGMANSPMVIKTSDALKKTVPNAEIAVMNPLPHDDGTNGATAVDSKWNWGTLVLPKTSKNPEKVLELLEYLNSEEGRKLTSVGIEGIHYKSYKDGVFYGVNAEEQAKDWDPAKAEGPTGSPMWWGLTSTINGIIPFDKYPNVQDALKNAMTFVTEEDQKSNPFWDMRKQGSLVTYHDPISVVINEWQEIVGKVTSIRQEFEAKLIMGSAGSFDKTWDQYLKNLDNTGLSKAVDAAQKWYDSNK
jgi:putative aldouronate transport system substrate-binding protein